MSMTEGEIQTFWAGVMAALNAKPLVVKNKNGYTDIINIDFKDNKYNCDIMMANGDVYHISNVVLSKEQRILSAYVSKGAVTKFIECKYVDGHLVAVGNVGVDNITNLNLLDYQDGNKMRW